MRNANESFTQELKLKDDSIAQIKTSFEDQVNSLKKENEQLSKQLESYVSELKEVHP